MEDAIQRAIDLAGGTAMTTKVVRYENADMLSQILSMDAGKLSVSEETLRSLVAANAARTSGNLTGAMGEAATTAELRRLVEEFATPRAWMLWTSLPAAFQATGSGDGMYGK